MITIHQLDLGFVEIPEEVLNIKASPRPVRVPVSAILLQAKNHTILYDTGCPDQCDLPWFGSSTQTLVAQLEQYGLRPSQVETVIISHAHSDHAGGASQFPHAQFWTPAEDTFSLSCPELSLHKVPVGFDQDLLPGVTLLSLPGHTPNLLGLLVNTGKQTLIFPSDAAYTPGHLAGILPKYCYNVKHYQDSIQKIRMLQELHHAEICYSHFPY